MSYLKDRYGRRSDEFYEGVKAGMEMYAWWKDGVQYVGTCGTTLKEAYAEVDKEAE